MEDEFLTRKRVAEIFNVTKTTIANWEKNGRLRPFCYVSGRPRYKIDHIAKTSWSTQKKSEQKGDGVIFTRKEVAKKMRVKPYTIWSWEKRGIIKPVFYVSGRPRYHINDIVAAQAKNQQVYQLSDGLKKRHSVNKETADPLPDRFLQTVEKLHNIANTTNLTFEEVFYQATSDFLIKHGV